MHRLGLSNYRKWVYCVAASHRSIERSIGSPGSEEVSTEAEYNFEIRNNKLNEKITALVGSELA